MILEIKNNHIMHMEFDEKSILSMGFSIHYFGKENSYSIPTKQKGTHFIFKKDGTLLVHDEYDTIKLLQVKSMEELSTILSVFC